MERWDSEPLWMIFEPPATVVRPEPEPVADEPSVWDIEKSRNRLARQVEKIERRRWLPTIANRLNGRAVQELRAAHDLLQEAGQVIQEAKR